MGKYYCGTRTVGAIDMDVLGFESDDGRKQEALVSLRHGANVCRYTYRGHTVIDYDPELLLAGGYTGTPVLYPTPNRVEAGLLRCAGRELRQTKRGKLITLHGLVYDEGWEKASAAANENEALLSASIRFCEGSPLFEAFPFRHVLTLTVRLTDGRLSIAYGIQSDTDEIIPYGFGLHPYFQKLSGERSTVIRLPVEYVMTATPELLPTGEIRRVAGTALDIGKPTPIGSLDLDHVFLRSPGGGTAVVSYPEQGFDVAISATPDFSHYVVYTPKGEDYFCIENQTCSTDAHNMFAKGFDEISGLKFLEPHGSAGGEVAYEIRPL